MIPLPARPALARAWLIGLAVLLATVWLAAFCPSAEALTSERAWPGALSGPVVLTVERPADTPEGNGVVIRFDLAMLQALPHRRFTSETIWTEGPQTFEGVLLRDLLDRLGVAGGEITASAANDYATIIPVTDATDPGPIIAYLRNGVQMSLRDKGPLWLVYPYDANPAWQTEVVYARSIWQLDHMVIAPDATSH